MTFNLSIREKRLLLVLAGVLMVFVFYQVVLGRLLPRINQIQDRLSVAQQQLQAARSRVEELPALEKQVQELEGELADMRVALATDLRRGQPFTELGNQLPEGIELVGIYPQALVTEDHYLKMPLQLTVRGDFPALLRLISVLEKLSGVTEILSIDLAQAVGDEKDKSVNDRILQAQLIMNIYGYRYSMTQREQPVSELGRIDGFEPVVQWFNDQNKPFDGELLNKDIVEQVKRRTAASQEEMQSGETGGFQERVDGLSHGEGYVFPSK